MTNTLTYKIVNQTFLAAEAPKPISQGDHAKGTSQTHVCLQKKATDQRLISYLATTGFNSAGQPFQFILQNYAGDDEIEQFADKIAAVISAPFLEIYDDNELIKAVIEKLANEFPKSEHQNFSIGLTAEINCWPGHKYIAICSGNFSVVKRNQNDGTEIIINPPSSTDKKIAELAWQPIYDQQAKILSCKAEDEICCALGVKIEDSRQPPKRSLFKKLLKKNSTELFASSVKMPTQKQIKNNIHYVNSKDHTVAKILIGLGGLTSLAGLSYPALIGFGSITLANTALGVAAAGFLALNWWIVLATGLGLVMAGGVSYVATEFNLFNTTHDSQSNNVGFKAGSAPQ